MTQFILDALISGRKVITNIEGVNYEKVSKITGIPKAILQTMLVNIFFDKVPEELEPQFQTPQEYMKHLFLTKTDKDMLVVIDEVEELWQGSNQKLPDDQAKFFTQHGHEGLDIIMMGQDMSTVHKMIRARVQKRFDVMKTSDKTFKINANERVSPDKYEHRGTQIKTYQKKYFGIYKSHTQGTMNYGNFKEKTSRLIKKRYIAFYVVLGSLVWMGASSIPKVFGIGVDDESHLAKLPAYDQAPPPPPKPTLQPSQVKTVKVRKQEYLPDGTELLPARFRAPQPDGSYLTREKQIAEYEAKYGAINPDEIYTSLNINDNPTIKPEITPEITPTLPPALDHFDSTAQLYKLRLMGILTGESGKLVGKMNAINRSGHIVDVFTIEELQALGWEINQFVWGLQISKDDVTHMARPLPIDVSWSLPDSTYK
jgi:zona occludens toxin